MLTLSKINKTSKMTWGCLGTITVAPGWSLAQDEDIGGVFGLLWGETIT